MGSDGLTDKYTIAIIGSGPAGLSAAARAAERGISHVLIEKMEHLSDTIFKYQKGKHIMATPEQLTLRSDLNFDAGSRESILDLWQGQAESFKTNILYNSEVKRVVGQKGSFELTLENGDTVKAENIVLGIGTQGNPNTMWCPGGDLPFVQYQLNDPREYFDEDIVLIGGGDAGIENALGLCAEPELENRVTLLQRAPDFPKAKSANVKALMVAKDSGRLNVINLATTSSIEQGWINIDVKDGTDRLPCDRVIARIGSAPPRKFVESCGVEFASDDRLAFPLLSDSFETSVSGLYVIGALAGYPLIKHCMNQGYDVVEHICGNTELKPADEPLLQEKFNTLPGNNTVNEWLTYLRENIDIFRPLSILQMREFMLDSKVSYRTSGDVIFNRNDIGSSLFSIANGSVNVHINAGDESVTVPISTGKIFGETGLISGRRRNAMITVAQDCILVETPRNAARKLIASVPAVKRNIDRIATERQLLNIFGTGITQEDIAPILDTAEITTVKANTTLIHEGEIGTDIYIIQSGSMVIEKTIGGKNIFLSYVPAGNYIGEMALLEDGKRTATVRAAIKSEIIKLDGHLFENLLEQKPLLKQSMDLKLATRKAMNAFVENEKGSFGSASDMYGARANFLIKQGLGEATDALLIDESLCIACNNCEIACAESHDGISRLNREAGTTFAELHVPTSCRHCEQPHCMSDCPPDAIHRAPDGEVFIDDSCIGCGNCQRNCPYGVIKMAQKPPKKPGLFSWALLGIGPGPGEANSKWLEKKTAKVIDAPKKAVKCDMCKDIKVGAACVRACPTGAAIRVSPEKYLKLSYQEREG